MAIFMKKDKAMRAKTKGNGNRYFAGVATVALSTLALLAPGANAQTEGASAIGAGQLLGRLIGTGGLGNPNDGSAIDLDDIVCAYIANPYIAVTLGLEGSYGVNWGGFTANHDVQGMISIGNRQGSRRYITDDRNELLGHGGYGPGFEGFIGSVPVGWGVWPIPGHWEEGATFRAADYSAYARLQVDDEVVSIVGEDPDTLVLEPQFVNNTLTANYELENGINVQLQIRLYRSTARFRWRITNADTVAHTVALRFTIPVRPGIDLASSPDRVGFFFDAPGIGITDNPQELNTANIPETLSIFGKRYQQDLSNDPPFGSQFRFRGFGATTPTRVQIRDSFEMRPENPEFDPIEERRPKISYGVAVASYWGPVVLQPAGTTEIVTYYGNGLVTERPEEDYVIGAEGPESLAYDTSAALDPALNGVTNPDPLTGGARFLSPSAFPIIGGIYNQVTDSLQTSINLTNVRASLTLPAGLAFTTRPGGTATDTADRTIGNVNSDRGADVDWYVRPTAEVFGALTYQVNFSSSELGARQINRVINVPVTPFRTVTLESYQMIGFPFEFDPDLTNNGDPSTIINSLTSPVDEPVSFFRWQPDPLSFTGVGSYVRVTQLENGIGYFYRPNINRTIYVKGVKPFPEQAPLGTTQFSGLNQRQVQLERGWNMIANPYLYEIPLTNLRFAPKENNPTVASQNFLQAVTSGLVRSGVFFFDIESQTYDFLQAGTDKLKPWEAYWIYVNNPVVMVYQLPFQQQSGVLPTPGNPPSEPPTRKRGAVATGSALVKDPSVDNWRLQLVATSANGKRDKATFLGVTNEKVTDNQRTMPKPPAPVEDYVYVGIVHENEVTRYAKDIKTGKTGLSWNVEIIADKDGPVTLTWPNAASLPRRVQLSLKDADTKRSISLRNSSAFTVNVRKGVPTRVTITAKTEASQKLMISGLRPVGGTRGTGTRSFAFNVNRDATVNAVIKTITGKTVATIATTRAATPGENRLSWTGRSQDGSPLPPGSYRIEITAHGEDGETATISSIFATIE
jgi:hypothetical protein